MKFVEESYLKNDQKAKNLLTKFLQHRGHQVFDNDDKYGIDLYSTIPNKKFWWEVEMKSKRPWTCRDDFKFDTNFNAKIKAKIPACFVVTFPEAIGLNFFVGCALSFSISIISLTI